MNKRYTNTIAGRVSPNIRNQMRPDIKAFAQTKGMEFNRTFGAVMWAAERMKGHISIQRVRELVTDQTVDAYRAELSRRTNARQSQIRGMIRRAISTAQPKPTEAKRPLIDAVFAKVANFQGSINALKANITQECRIAIAAPAAA